MNPFKFDPALFSKKKRNILLALKENPGRTEDLKALLNESPSSIGANLKKLIEGGLVLGECGFYRLSDMAVPIVDNLKDLLCSLEFFEENLEYLAAHDLNPIPAFLREDLDKLGRTELFEPGPGHIFEAQPVFWENIRKSKEIFTFFSFLHPDILFLCRELAEEGVKLSICMTEPAAQRVYSEFQNEAKKLEKATNSSIFICRRNVNLPGFVVTDRLFAIRLLKKSGRFSGPVLVSYEAGALEWGLKLYEYFKNASIPAGSIGLMPERFGMILP